MPDGTDAAEVPAEVPEGRAATGNGAAGSSIASRTLPVHLRSPGAAPGHEPVTARASPRRLRNFSEKGIAGAHGFS